VTVSTRDEGRHEPGPERLWNESWYFDFTTHDGSLGGWVRLGLYPNLGVAWYHAFLVGPGRPTIAVVDHEVPVPRSTLEIRTHGLWADHMCETAVEHWTVANETHAIALDDPADLYGKALGTPTPLAVDLEWETDGEAYPYPGVTRYEIPCTVHGEILLGDETIAFDGHGQRDHSWGVRDWWQFGWCWTAGRLSDGTRFHGSDIRIPGLDLGFGYEQPPSGELIPAPAVNATEALGDHGFPTAGHVDIGDLALDIEPLAFAPVLLTAPDGRLSRFPRALCRFTHTDGRTGHGWTEWNQPQ
jgi:hypothetical protein